MAGAGFGYTLLWAILFSILATVVLQEMSARLGVVGEMGVGEALRKKITHKLLFSFAANLVISAILIGNAAYEAGNITGAVLGFEISPIKLLGTAINPLVILIGLVAFLLLFSGKFKLIERSLVLLVGVLGGVFLLAAILLKPDLGAVFSGLFVPALPDDSLLMVLGLIGTTVVPYNLFLHASSVKEKWKGTNNLSASRWDTYLSVIFGGIITMAILITSAVAFSGQAKTVSSAADLAQQLTPILGDWSLVFIAIGFLAAGLSSSITAPLAAAFATSEIMGWKKNLKGKNFRMIWFLVLIVGIVFSSLGFKPTQVILFAQVANGLLLPIVAAFLVWVMNDKQIMGKHANSLLVNIIGILVIIITLVLGLKGIFSAFKLI
ncbi:MAG: Nramp family divalent metal transporter [Bacteroidota bacterium]